MAMIMTFCPQSQLISGDWLLKPEVVVNYDPFVGLNSIVTLSHEDMLPSRMFDHGRIISYYRKTMMVAEKHWLVDEHEQAIPICQEG